MPRFTFFARGAARELLAIRGSGSTASCLDLGRALAIRRTREPPQSQRLRTQTQGHTVLALVMTCAGQALQEGPLACRGCSPERRHIRESRPKPLRLGTRGPGLWRWRRPGAPDCRWSSLRLRPRVSSPASLSKHSSSSEECCQAALGCCLSVSESREAETCRCNESPARTPRGEPLWPDSRLAFQAPAKK